MHDDQLRSMLRTLERDHEPDPAFADALYGQLQALARVERRSRGPMLLLAAALLALLAAGLAVGSGLVKLPLVLEPMPSGSSAPSAVAVASPSLQPSSESPVPSPSEEAEPRALEGRVLVAEADGLAIRAEPTPDGALVARVNAGQTMGVAAGPVEADGLRWYEVVIGPGELAGWVTSGPERAWLRLVDDGAVGFRCDAGCGTASLVSVTPLGDAAITGITEESYREWTWSADGTRIAATFDVGNAGDAEIVVMDADGSNRRSLGAGYGPAWSPDGSRLAWSVGTTIVVTDEELVPAELDLELPGAGTPMWSPDATRLAFGAVDCPECPPDEPIIGDPPSATWIVGVDGSGLRQLTGGDYSGLVDWSPDGTTLAFVQFDLSGEFQSRAYTLPVAGGDRTYLEDGTAILTGPSWSPDGRSLLYATPAEIVIASEDGGVRTTLAPAPVAGLGSLAWSPSGSWIVYSSSGIDDGVRPGIWIAPVDGSEPPRPIFASDASLLGVAWQAVLEPLP